MVTRQIVLEQTSDYAIVRGKALRQDDPAIRRVYDDGIHTLTSSRTGRHLMPPYRVDDDGVAAIAEDWAE